MNSEGPDVKPTHETISCARYCYPPRLERAPTTPQDLYDRLTVTDPAIGALWMHQGHILERYYEYHRDTADVACDLGHRRVGSRGSAVGSGTS